MVVATSRRGGNGHKATTMAGQAAVLTTPQEPTLSDHEISVWKGDAFIVSVSDTGNRRYLRRRSLQFFLSQVQDGQPFQFKGMHTSKEDDFGSNEYNLITRWLRINGLAERNGRQYMIPSIENVKRAWNDVVTHEAVL